MSKELKVIYEPHPVTAERKAELRARGYRIIDAVFAPPGYRSPDTKPARSNDALREDGPTVAEFVAAGYPADKYPPSGYASRSTPEEIAAAVAAQASAAGRPFDHDGDGKPGGSLPSVERGLDDLRAKAESLGIKVDKRWGEARLRDEIAKT
ncbi:hypothetical protein [Afipia carboxidovorans]|uniref:hypothetical protein n=1 Tax=Afipia carboxidovorans TaxID=40137 RepID=UPI0030866EAC|nr:hypothetical protein CRBSH125_01130 [Afipia carboxidovorans]